MIFEAVIDDVKEATYTVRDIRTGATYNNCRLCTMGLADWCIDKNDYVLCEVTDYGNVYILGEIKGTLPSTEGFRIGNMRDKFLVTNEAVVIHKKETSELLIDEEGMQSFYKKALIKGFGWSITCAEDSIIISVSGSAQSESGIVITPTEVKIFGNESGGILKGNEAQKQIDDLADKLNSLINKFNGHGHISQDTQVPGTIPPVIPCMTTQPQKNAPLAPTPVGTMVPIPESETTITKKELQSKKVKSS